MWYRGLLNFDIVDTPCGEVGVGGGGVTPADVEFAFRCGEAHVAGVGP